MRQLTVMMKRVAMGALFPSTLAAAPAFAQSPDGRLWHWVVGGGFTFGGDNLASIIFNDGSSDDVRAGELVQFYGGIKYQSVSQFSVQGTLGYHYTGTRANSDATFEFARFPLEVLGHFHPSNNLAFGGGLRFVNGAKLKASGIASGLDVTYDNTVGVVVEGEYLFAPEFS